MTGGTESEPASARPWKQRARVPNVVDKSLIGKGGEDVDQQIVRVADSHDELANALRPSQAVVPMATLHNPSTAAR